MEIHPCLGRANIELRFQWWARRESNPHGFPRRILSPLRLPFRHSPLVEGTSVEAISVYQMT